MNGFTRFVLRRAGWILGFSAIISVLGIYFSVLLYMNLKPDIEELLPRTSRSVIDLFEVRERLKSTQNLGVLIFSDHPKKSKQFVDELVKDLNSYPEDLVAGVEYRINREMEFFNTRKPLYMELIDLEKIRSYIADKIRYEKALYNPLNIFSNIELREPTLSFGALEEKYMGKVGSYSHLPDGYYATKDEKIRAVLVNLPGTLSGVDGAHRFREAVDKSIERVDPNRYSSDIQIKFTGGVQDLIEEHSSLMADLELSAMIVMVLVTAAMALFYRSILGTFALIASLLIGSFWAFGISYFAVGYLNANSAFLGAIVIGNGINFGLILLARYLEEVRKKRGHIRAVHAAISRTATATWVAALAAGLSYGSLAFTEFRGFRQFGIIGLIGMLLCWVSAFSVLPALLTVMDNWFGYSQRIKRSRRPKQFFSVWAATLVKRRPRLVWNFSLVLTGLSIVSFLLYDGQVLETNLDNLRDRRSAESGSAYNSHYLHQIFQGYPHPIAILSRSPEDAKLITKRIKERQEREGSESMIAAVYSLDDFLPVSQNQKIKLLGRIQSILNPELVAQLSKEDKQRVKEFLHPNSFKVVRAKDLPPLVKKKLTEKNGTMGNLVLVEPPLGGQTSNALLLVDFINGLREEADKIRPGTPVAGQLAVSADMITAIKRDGPVATAMALAAVLILVVFLFRNLGTISSVLAALFFGVIWLAAIVLQIDLKINFLNFIALPITFGIGVDYAVNVFQRYQLEKKRNIVRVIKSTGGAVVLASMTTVIGYGSLLIAGNQAFVSFGLLSVLGEFTCVFAAVFALPAYLTLQRQKAARLSLVQASGHPVSGLVHDSGQSLSGDRVPEKTTHSEKPHNT